MHPFSTPEKRREKVCIGNLWVKIKYDFCQFIATQGFPNIVKGWGEWEFFLGGIFSDGWNLRRSAFDHSNLFQS